MQVNCTCKCFTLSTRNGDTVEKSKWGLYHVCPGTEWQSRGKRLSLAVSWLAVKTHVTTKYRKHTRTWYQLPFTCVLYSICKTKTIFVVEKNGQDIENKIDKKHVRYIIGMSNRTRSKSLHLVQFKWNIWSKQPDNKKQKIIAHRRWDEQDFFWIVRSINTSKRLAEKQSSMLFSIFLFNHWC